MKPVWIKYYGLIPMTKRGYLITLAVVGPTVVVFFLIAAALGLMPPVDTMWSSRHRLPGSGAEVWIYNYGYWLILVCLVGQAIDTWVTLCTFAKKEAEQRRQLEKEWDRLDSSEGYPPPDDRIRR